ncbi:hypothetical protein CDG79_20735 [Nostoc sp. 'Peltigera membranacea cyanobiont' 232]|nr:hypothetical protein CDG79_20735 [Nostoc sp. 'Peltigera membranacea cyanobiont' 232]
MLERLNGKSQIDGLGILTVQTIISEVGLDPTRFPTVKHFTWRRYSEAYRSCRKLYRYMTIMKHIDTINTQ